MWLKRRNEFLGTWLRSICHKFLCIHLTLSFCFLSTPFLYFISSISSTFLHSFFSVFYFTVLIDFLSPLFECVSVTHTDITRVIYVDNLILFFLTIIFDLLHKLCLFIRADRVFSILCSKTFFLLLIAITTPFRYY